jgi:hypothetical protein
MQVTSMGNSLLEGDFNGEIVFFQDYPKGENGLWAPLDLLKCTSSANTVGIPDGWGPNFYLGSLSFPGFFSFSPSLFQAPSFFLLECLYPFRVTSS